MAFYTASGLQSTATSGGTLGPVGLPVWNQGHAPSSGEFNGVFTDLQSLPYQSMQAGVIAGGVCTASALLVTIPAATNYYAKQLWLGNSGTTLSVPDGSTTYIWGCSDGQLRTSASATVPPTAYDGFTACLLCKATASAGVATVDNTVQWRARSYSGATRLLTDGLLSQDMANRYVTNAGGQRGNVQAYSANRTVLVSDSVCQVSATHTETLPPAASSIGMQVTFIKTDGGGTTITIQGNAAELISGKTQGGSQASANTYLLASQYDAVTLVCNAAGTGWLVVSRG